MTTEYVDKILATNAELESVSYNHDTVMFEVDNAGYTQRTMSFDTTESHTLGDSTRASTPTEAFGSDPVALPMTPRAGDPVAASDDVPMMDISPGREKRATSLEKSNALKDSPLTPFEGLEIPPYVDVTDGDDATEPDTAHTSESHNVSK